MMEQFLATNMPAKQPAITLGTEKAAKNRQGFNVHNTLEHVHVEATLAIGEAVSDVHRMERFLLGGLTHTVLTAKHKPADAWLECLGSDARSKCTWAALSQAISELEKIETIARPPTVVQTHAASQGWEPCVLHCKVKLTYVQDRFKVQWWVDPKLSILQDALCELFLALDLKTEILRKPPPKFLKGRVMNSKVAALKDFLA
eukprot:TRINITY_DN20830_c1_g1_i1.p2 TRINITY_DN20830_c1_g1~~TRINITY_DN20830_c1_g1_i1.p2  ORF type:complete len:202 (-),score=38.99 TRINITY_DN20830_c1_g1_i1:263-868(-)